ncbi:rhophilin-1 isoform X3 [Antennarius striatus]|uniref:rhophilin-1 isoform X3 n=1 Tax=Antennarius striatus TaxID=241820 RepID=UPI0035ADD773
MEQPAIRDLQMSPPDGASDDDLPSAAPVEGGLGGSIRKGCDPLAQTQRSKLQHRRARINQQINKEMRMRAGAENLFRATTNSRVRETVALELSFVNSNLQLLKEELEELNSSMEVYQTDSEAINVPMIPLGLKETKEVDFSVSIQDFICEHYGEDGSLYDKEIQALMELRQAMRTPSRNQAGLELLMEYYNQMFYLDQRFFPLHRNLGVHFHWYDSLTGVPSCQRTLAFEKGSVLFNIAALYTQMGARQDRSAPAGIDKAVDAFQRAAGTQPLLNASAHPRRFSYRRQLPVSGAFNYLKENFSNAPSLDMSSPSLCMLVQLMVAQVQECVFERVTLTTRDAHVMSQLRLAQEAARVSDVYLLAQQTMVHPLMKDYVPFSWASVVQVKAEHFRALAHFHAAVALCNRTLSADDEEGVEEAFLTFYVSGPAGPPLSRVLRDPETRRKLGKAHLRRAVIRHEEAMRVHGLCRILRKMDLLQDVLALTHKRSLDMYARLDREDDFDETVDAPEIQHASETRSHAPQLCRRPDQRHLPATGAPVRLLRSRPLGPRPNHLPAEGGGRPGPHPQRGLPRPGGRSRSGGMCGGGGATGGRLHRGGGRAGLQVGQTRRGGPHAEELRRPGGGAQRGHSALARGSGRPEGCHAVPRRGQRKHPAASAGWSQGPELRLFAELEQEEEEGRGRGLKKTRKHFQLVFRGHPGR